MTKANIAVIGAGWWSQGWHLPHVERNPRAKLVAIVETNPHPSSNLAKLVSREELGTKYPHAFIYSSVQELIANHMQQDSEIRMDGVIVATPHATHFAICQELMAAKIQLSMLLEKPMTASVKEAYELHKRIFQQSTMNFMINHTANYRPQAFAARDLVAAKCGRLRHAMISFASPLADLFVSF
jgi:predicted dehydrogenase